MQEKIIIMFITLVPSYVAPMYPYVTSVFVYNRYMFACTRMFLICALVCSQAAQALVVRSYFF